MTPADAAPQIVEAVILRDPQPNDVVAFKVTHSLDQAALRDLVSGLRELLPCKVLVLSEEITMFTEPPESADHTEDT